LQKFKYFAINVEHNTTLYSHHRLCDWQDM